MSSTTAAALPNASSSAPPAITMSCCAFGNGSKIAFDISNGTAPHRYAGLWLGFGGGG
jgi:hypothetical protein